MPAWPSTLPKYPLQSNYSRSIQDGRVFEQMQSGRTRQRLLYQDMPDRFQLSYSLTLAEWLIFENFFKTDLKNGSLPVDIWLRTPAGDITKTVQILKRDNDKPDGADKVTIGFSVEVVN